MLSRISSKIKKALVAIVIVDLLLVLCTFPLAVYRILANYRFHSANPYALSGLTSFQSPKIADFVGWVNGNDNETLYVATNKCIVGRTNNGRLLQSHPTDFSRPLDAEIYIDFESGDVSKPPQPFVLTDITLETVLINTLPISASELSFSSSVTYTKLRRLNKYPALISTLGKYNLNVTSTVIHPQDYGFGVYFSLLRPGTYSGNLLVTYHEQYFLAPPLHRSVPFRFSVIFLEDLMPEQMKSYLDVDKIKFDLCN